MTIMPTSRKPQKSLVHAHEVGALHPRIESFFSGVRMPMYKTNDSDDLHLMELISPSHELHRKLIEGNRRPMTQQQQQQYLPSPNKRMDTTPRTKYKQAALKTLRSFPLSATLNAKLFGTPDHPTNLFTTDHARPRSANTGLNHHKKRKPSTNKLTKPELTKPELTKPNLTKPELTKPEHQKNLTTMAKQMHHQNTLDLEDIRIYKSELSTHRKSSDTDTTSSGFSSERRSDVKLGQEQKAYDLRIISKLWHQECERSIPIQQKLGLLLDLKYKEMFENGRMPTLEKCKHGDFKAEVAQILKNLERAGAPQMASLNLKYELAVGCVDEVVGEEGLGVEYVRLEGYGYGNNNVRSSSTGVWNVKRDGVFWKEIGERVRGEYGDVQRIAGFMLSQLDPSIVA